jgi:hypothetical protein
LDFLSFLASDVLAVVARDDRIAREELANRGMSDRGRWGGFDQVHGAGLK